MIPKEAFDELRRSLAATDEDEVMAAFNRIMASSPTTQELEQTLGAIQGGMEDVGQRFQDGEYFLAEMIYAADLVNGIMPQLTGKLAAADRKPSGRVVLGTVKGDIHDIGKNLVGVLLTAAGFDVIDLGTDVSPQRFVAAIQKHQPQIVALSGLLTLSIDPMKETAAAIRDAGLAGQVKVLIGGNPVTEHIHQIVGSDGWTNNAAEGVAQCRRWVEA